MDIKPQWKIPLSDIDLDQDETDAVVKVLQSKWLSMGPVTQNFEAEFAKYLGVKCAFAVSNATAALHLACKVLELGPGDEVLVPSLTFVATSNAILYVGATPVFVDITSTDNFNLSPEDISRKITGKTKGIMLVHYGGFPCDMEAIIRIAKNNGLKIIEDAAHAPGAVYRNRKLGTIGDIGCFSFFANKNMATGEGGMIVTNNESIGEKIRTIRSHGMTTMTWDRHQGHAHSYDVVDLGYNYRINEIASAIGLIQLKKLESNNQKRENISGGYRKRLAKITRINIPFSSNIEKSSYHIFPILLGENVNRGSFIENLKSKGIQSSIHYPPIHLFKYYRDRFGYGQGLLPLTEQVAKREVTLPLYPMMKEDEIEYITNVIKKFLSDGREIPEG